MTTPLDEVFQRLLARYGPQHWWPGESRFEVLVGTVLVQNTSWKNVERAIENLRQAELLELEAVHRADAEELAELIRPAGYYRQKAARLKRLVEWIHRQYGSLEAMLDQPADTLRGELLALNGIGPETADSILLYALGKPVFVVDTYTRRMLARHGWAEFDEDYAALQGLFHATLGNDAPVFNEFHALIVALGKAHCGKRPQCSGCPLETLLPAEGPLQPPGEDT